VGPRAGLDDMGRWKFLKSLGHEIQSLGRPVSISAEVSRLSFFLCNIQKIQSLRYKKHN
jgi:hypothetical protein